MTTRRAFLAGLALAVLLPVQEILAPLAAHEPRTWWDGYHVMMTEVWVRGPLTFELLERTYQEIGREGQPRRQPIVLPLREYQRRQPYQLLRWGE